MMMNKPQNSPQLENGFIQIASGQEKNDVLMALVKQSLNGTQYQIMLLVIRKTWGYKKLEAWISLTQFENYLSKSRVSVCKELKALVNYNLLVAKTIPGVRVLYSVNKDFNQWKKLVNKTSLVNNTLRTSKQKFTPLVNKSLPTKDNNTKDNNTKETLYRKPEVVKTSKNSRTACTNEELSFISRDMGCEYSKVRMVHDTIMDKISAGDFKDKTVYFTLRQWLRMRIEKGTLKISKNTIYEPNEKFDPLRD